MRNVKKNRISALLGLLGIGLGQSPVLAADRLVLESKPTPTKLLELFSSEGCSSCPPADAWLASLRHAPGLWTRFVPVEFHVDYWNRLGWTDRFSKETFTSRQQQYAREWGNGNVYTPGLVLDGAEWHAGLGPDLDAVSKEPVGVLRVSQTGPSTYDVRFKPPARAGALKIYGALLGNGLTSKVTSGENSGRTLAHEFVVLSVVSQTMDESGGDYSAVLSLRASQPITPLSFSVAFWVARDGRQKPIQAVGGDL